MFSPDQDLIAVYLQRFSSENTRTAYRTDLDLFFSFLGTGRSTSRIISRIDTAAINSWIEHLEQEFRPRTVNRKVSCVRGFFEWLIAIEVLHANPAHPKVIRRIAKVRSSDNPILSLSKEDASHLIRTASSHRDRAMISVLLYCVLRRSELVAMNVEHIQFAGKHPILVIPDSKGGKDQYVKIPAPAYAELTGFIAEMGISRGAIWLSTSNRNKGGRLTARSVYNILRESALKSGLQHIHPHMLRHTGCTLAIDAGASVPEVQVHARHQSINTTMTYVHQKNRLTKSAGDYIDLDV